jgi:DNA-binding NarL/FixJ family response regulator
MKPVRVLLADDHAVLRAGLRLLIDAEPDMTVVAEAADGAQAVARARQTHAEIVVLDLSMPRTDPPLTIRQLARVGARTVVLTMHDDPAYVRGAVAAGAMAYVVKRAADVELLTAIRAVSRGCRFLEAAPGRARGAETDVVRGLSAREREVLRLVGLGFTNREIALRLGVSVKTVETFRARVCDKLGLRTRADLVAHAMRAGLLTSEDGSPPSLPRPPHRA